MRYIYIYKMVPLTAVKEIAIPFTPIKNLNGEFAR